MNCTEKRGSKVRESNVEKGIVPTRTRTLTLSILSPDCLEHQPPMLVRVLVGVDVLVGAMPFFHVAKFLRFYFPFLQFRDVLQSY